MTLQEILEQAPATIHALGQTMVQKRKLLEMADHELDVAKAKAVIRHQDAKNQTIINALVTYDEEVMAAEIAVIDAKAKFKTAEIDWQAAENQFVSARKLAGMDAAEMRALAGPPSQLSR